MNKPTKPETLGQFHGRTLLMGKKVPPRSIPLEPLYISKPYTTSGKKQIRPMDPRSKYYSNGGLERRIIKQMQEEAQKMIENLGKAKAVKLPEQNSDFEVHKVDIKLENPFQILLDKSKESQETTSGSRSLNTMGAELEKRLHTQVQVAYKKLLEQGVSPEAIVEQISTTIIPTETSYDLDNPRIFSDKSDKNPHAFSSNSDIMLVSSGGNVTDPWTSSVRECEESKQKERAQLRKEAERQLKIVERRLSELQEDNYSGKEDGEVFNDSDGLEKKRNQENKQNDPHQKSKCTDNESGGNLGEDVVDPWESPFQSESIPPEPPGCDPWSSTAMSGSAYQDYVDNNRIRNRYSGARYFGTESYSSGRDRSVPPWTYRSHSPSYEGYRSNSSRDKHYHSSSRSPEYRYHYDPYASPEKRRYRSRSRSPDYRR